MDPLEKAEGTAPPIGRKGARNPIGLPGDESTVFGFRHKHTGLHGDGQRVKSASLDTVDPFTVELEPTYTPVNASTSGRKYRIQIIEVTDPETSQIQPVIQVVPAD